MSGRKRRHAAARRAAAPRQRGWLRWAIPLAVAALALMAVRLVPGLADASGSSATAAAAPEDGVNAPAAPPFVVTTLDGRPMSDDQLRGRVVLVNFWATWCPPCRAEMPGFEAVYQRFSRSDFTVLGVAMDVGSPAGVQRFLTDGNITYPVAMATGSVVRNFGGANFLPNSFLIDAEGRIRREVRGVYEAELLARDVRQLLDERDLVAR